MSLHLSIGLLTASAAERRPVHAQTDSITIGRHKSCDLTISHASLSRQHCRIYQHDRDWLVSDLGSSAGTLVNHRPITQPCMLKAGDLISCGEVAIVIDQCTAPSGADSSARRRVTLPQASADNPEESVLRESKSRRISAAPRKKTSLLAAAREPAASETTAARKQRLIRPRAAQDQDTPPRQPSTIELMVGDLNYQQDDLANASDFFDLSDSD